MTKTKLKNYTAS